MEALTFDQLPQAVTILTAELRELRKLILQKKEPQKEQTEEFLNIKQAAELLNLSVPTMYSKVSKNELPVMKQGKRLYFSRTELIAYLRSGKKKSQAEIEAEAEQYFNHKKSAAL